MEQKIDVRQKIIEAFYETLKKNSFAKVRVTNIIALAGISHQTFYRYFLDKHDLARQIVYDRFAAFYDIYNKNATWKEIVLLILNSIRSYPVFFKRLLEDSDGVSIISDAFIQTTYNFTGKGISKHTAASWTSIIGEWAINNYERPIDEVYYQWQMHMPLIEVLSKEECDKIMALYEGQTLDYFSRKTNEASDKSATKKQKPSNINLKS